MFKIHVDGLCVKTDVISLWGRELINGDGNVKHMHPRNTLD